MTDAGRSHSPTDGLSAFCRIDTGLAICNQRSSMARDLLVLLRSENKHRAAGCRITDGIGDGAVSHIIKDNTHPVQATADLGAYFRIIFSDSAGENDQIDSFKRRDHRRHLFTHRVAEH
jgi:hypothetical protein